jgi:hypothetical protein
MISRLNCPAFDLCFASSDGDNYILIAGGGGSAKSGIKNQIILVKCVDEKVQFLPSFETNKDDKSILCSALSFGIIKV